MDCTLFGSTANELMNYMEKNNQPTFIIVQFAKISSWNGNNSLYLLITFSIYTIIGGGYYNIFYKLL